MEAASRLPHATVRHCRSTRQAALGSSRLTTGGMSMLKNNATPKVESTLATNAARVNATKNSFPLSPKGDMARPELSLLSNAEAEASLRFMRIDGQCMPNHAVAART